MARSERRFVSASVALGPLAIAIDGDPVGPMSAKDPVFFARRQGCERRGGSVHGSAVSVGGDCKPFIC